MRDWTDILRFVRDNVTLIVFVLVVAIMAGAWIVFEALRSHKSREELFKLRMKLRALEMERAGGGPKFTDPVVLSTRWIRTGGAATTSDGGCLLYVDRVSAETRSAEVTLRVDGYAVLQRQGVGVGQRLEANGKYGTYILELYAVEGIQANLAVALRNRHQDASA
jgi:hypothetical protein